MNSPSTKSSPSYKNIRLNKHRQSPIEMKEKIRKSYKDRIQNCRNTLLNKIRGSAIEVDIHVTITELYKDMFSEYSDKFLLDEEENMSLEEIKNEIIQEEIWWLEEYEKSEMLNVDWSTLEKDDDVICPVCQKTNITVQYKNVQCQHCKYTVTTQKSLPEIKQAVLLAVETHSANCTGGGLFNVVQESNETYIYFICQTCMEIQIIT